MGNVAAALRYDESMPAPIVAAGGRNHLADRLLALAREYGVPVVEAGDLAESLVQLEPYGFIPEEMYAAVATILAFVMQTQADGTDE